MNNNEDISALKVGLSLKNVIVCTFPIKKLIHFYQVFLELQMQVVLLDVEKEESRSMFVNLSCFPIKTFAVLSMTMRVTIMNN